MRPVQSCTGLFLFPFFYFIISEVYYGKQIFAELSRRLNADGIESCGIEDKRLEVFLHSQPVLYVSPASDVFLLPAGSQNVEASELYHQVAMAADEVYGYVEAMQTPPCSMPLACMRTSACWQTLAARCWQARSEKMARGINL